MRDEKKRKREIEEQRREDENERRKESSTASKKKAKESAAATKSKEKEDASVVAKAEEAVVSANEVPMREVTQYLRFKEQRSSSAYYRLPVMMFSINTRLFVVPVVLMCSYGAGLKEDLAVKMEIPATTATTCPTTTTTTATATSIAATSRISQRYRYSGISVGVGAGWAGGARCFRLCTYLVVEIQGVETGTGGHRHIRQLHSLY